MIDRQALGQFVPHKERMFLLDRVTNYSLTELWLESEVDITRASLFWDPQRQGVPAWVAFEYMAQSIAALSGIFGFELDRAQPKIGFIIGVRDFECGCGSFALGNRLCIHVAQIFRDGAIVSFNCRASIGNQEIVKAIINAIEVDDQGVQSMIGNSHV